MRALLVIAHGSRRQASNEEVQQLAQALGARLADSYQYVNAGFLEMAEPSIEACMLASIAAGAKQIDVLPYFLSAGRHVVTDVPEDVKAVADKNPDVSVKILPYVGSVPGMVELMADICCPPKA